MLNIEEHVLLWLQHCLINALQILHYLKNPIIPTCICITHQTRSIMKYV